MRNEEKEEDGGGEDGGKRRRKKKVEVNGKREIIRWRICLQDK